ncbi:MAG TPA: class I SAM-dependent methyltransferase [Candidatus Paceibacterota bacterium]|nr:class I SAM-dependent methyltransferase [Candidatus Paceibacterota bacterium]
MEQVATTPIVGSGNSLSTGGFLNPDSIVNEFGVKERMSIADFGSGAGYFTILMAERAGKEGRVYALDIMESALDSVREKAKAAGLENIEMIRTNLEVVGSSGLADQSQDIVLLANILFQSDKKSDIVKEAKRVLRDNGSLIIIDWKKGAGGFGPPDSLRTDETAMRSLAMGEGLIFDKVFNAGQFHFGVIFKKTIYS